MTRTGLTPTPSPIGAPPGWETVLPATSHDVRAALQLILEKLVELSTPQNLRDRIELVLAETMNNVVEHAYADQPCGQISVWFSYCPQRFCVEISDCGCAMPDEKIPLLEQPELQSVEDLPEGGFGWFIIHALTTVRRYTRDGDTNRIYLELSGTA